MAPVTSTQRIADEQLDQWEALALEIVGFPNHAAVALIAEVRRLRTAMGECWMQDQNDRYTRIWSPGILILVEPREGREWVWRVDAFDDAFDRVAGLSGVTRDRRQAQTLAERAAKQLEER